jgi:hypothetical protein
MHQRFFFSNKSRGPPSDSEHWQGEVNRYLPLLQVSKKSGSQKLEGSNSWCDPTVRALENQTRSLASDLCKVIVSLSRRKGKTHICDVS